MNDSRFYDPYFEDYALAVFNTDSSLGYRRGVWAYTPGMRPFWFSETLGL